MLPPLQSLSECNQRTTITIPANALVTLEDGDAEGNADLSEFVLRIRFSPCLHSISVHVANACGGNRPSGKTSASKTFAPDSFWSASFVIQAERSRSWEESSG
jgi:hypothetical protein